MDEKSLKPGISSDWQRGRTLNPSDTKKMVPGLKPYGEWGGGAIKQQLGLREAAAAVTVEK